MLLLRKSTKPQKICQSKLNETFIFCPNADAKLFSLICSSSSHRSSFRNTHRMINWLHFDLKYFFFVETWIDLLVHKILFCLLIPRPLKWLMCNGKQFEITFKVEYLRCFSLLLYATMRLDLNVLADSNCWRSFQSNEQSKSFKLTSTAKINGQ